jgi:cytochrome c peroxidase
MRLALALALLSACGGPPEPPPAEAPPADKAPEKSPDEALAERARGLFGVLPDEMPADHNPLTEAKIELGRNLYYDPRLSLAGDISCNTCHLLDNYGVDGLPTSKGHKGQLGDRNAPTVYNAALHMSQFWDGREPHVEAQAKGPPLNPVEMAMTSGDAVAAVFAAVPGYAPLFAAAFPGEDNPITYDNIGTAIGAFERRLVTKDPFDAFQNGDIKALSAEQKAGLNTFMDVGCTTCHMGPLLGGTSFQKLGMVHPFEDADLGRMKATGDEADKQFYKVPSLRNVAKTGPYFHNGKVATLDESIKLMGYHQLGRELTDEQVASIASFLGALTGDVPTAYIAKPELPK